MKRLTVVIAMASLATAVTACGDDDDDASPATTAVATPASTAPSGSSVATFNDADVAFAQAMIPHHQQALEMAEMALDPAVGASPDVMGLATAIKAAQQPEIDLMTGWLESWGEPPTSDAAGHDMTDTTAMTGMMSDEEMASMSSMAGADFDQMWLSSMIEHHHGAIEMATTEQEQGSDPAAVQLAGEIISAQQAEIDQMETLLADGD